MAAGIDRGPVLSEKDWKAFLSNGRPTLRNSCVIWCEAYFDHGEMFVFRQQNQAQSKDAERLALLKLRDEEMKRRYRTTLREVHFYVSYSPCLMCSYEMIQFASDRRETLQMKIIFTACYLLTDQRHRQGLEGFSEQTPHLRICTVKASDWQHLAGLRRERKPLEEIETAEERRHREIWDAIYSEQFESALQVVQRLQSPSILLSHEELCRMHEQRFRATP